MLCFMDRNPHAPVRKGAYEPLTAAEHRENMVPFKAQTERANRQIENAGFVVHGQAIRRPRSPA
jgi:hypothetical protein